MEPGEPATEDAYPSFGMPDVAGRLWKLRCLWLQNVMYSLMDTEKHHRYFGMHAYGTVREWFAMLMWFSPFPGPGPGPGPQEIGAFGEEKLDEPLLDLMPFIVMFSKFVYGQSLSWIL